MRFCNRRFVVSGAVLFLSLCVAVHFAAARGGGGHGGGGHGGGHAGGGHAGGHGGAAHHAGEHHGGAAHHDEHHGGQFAHHGNDHHWDHNGYNHWGHPGWGGWAGGLGLGAVGAYAYDQPFSVPLGGVDYDPTYAYGPPINNYAQNDSPDDEEANTEDGGDNSNQESADDKEEDIDHRAAIQLVLPDKDAHVFLNGKLVPGIGTRRLIMTPELDDDDPKVKSYPFHVLAVWEENGRPAQREAELDLAPGAGGVLNLTVATTKPAAGAKPAAATTTTGPAASAGRASPTKSVASDK